MRERTRLPVVLKGILHPDDARRAFDQGVDAIVVSNHGGRQVDSSIASLDALQDIRAAVGDEPTLLMDSGIRTGADVFTAVALGADAVLLGRPYMYGLAVAGTAWCRGGRGQRHRRARPHDVAHGRALAGRHLHRHAAAQP